MNKTNKEMKKIFILTALALMSVSVQAQTADNANEAANGANSKYSVETNTFWSNWFVSAGATYNMFYTGQEKNMEGTPGLFDGSRSTMGLSLAVGKWFTPGFGLRTKMSGIWGRYVTPDATGSWKNKSNNSYKYWSLQEQMLFNLHNLFRGYNEQRVWECIPFFGFGMTRNMSGNDNAHGWSLGLLNSFKVSQRLAVNLELGMNMSDDKIFNAALTNHQEYGTTFEGMDRNFSVEVGVTYSLGKTGWKKTPDVEAIKTISQSEIDALNDRLRVSEAEKTQAIAGKDARIAQLEGELAQCKAAANAVKTTVVEKGSTTLQPTVVFRQGKSTIEPSQYASIEMVAKYMKNHPDAKILIKGYASPEGNQELNQALSKARAEAVRSALVNRYKIAANRLTAEGFGATDSLFDEAEFNRVVTFSDTTK